jgi:hypothetical protein
VAVREEFQRLFMMAEPEALSLNAQAALSDVQPERSQFSLLLRHFLERFFNHETASPDGDAEARLVLIAFAVGLPPFVVALYLWPVYHPFSRWPTGHGHHPGPPAYWLQVNHHLFFLLYSFVAMGIATLYEWDLFFPDLLDIFVLTTLPVVNRRLFLARVAAIAILIAGFLFDANILAPLVLPAAIDPPNIARFLAGHLLAVTASGLYAALFILALQGVLLSVFGERLFRKLSFLIQGLSISVLLMLLLLFPVISDAVPVLLQSGSVYTLLFPPFWFLGIYQRLMDGPSALPVYSTLAETGCVALMVTAGLAAFAYPIAYTRRVRQLVEGPGTRIKPRFASLPLQKLLHATVIRHPVRRAVFHFISETLFRVPRYQIYLVLYGGVGLSVVVASMVRFTVASQRVQMEISADGIRAATAIVGFWMIAGMRMAFVSSGNQKGNWVFRVVHGRPPHFPALVEELLAANVWILVWGEMVTLGFCFGLRAISPPALQSWQATGAQMLVSGGMCFLLTDMFFLNVTTVAFTGEAAREEPNFALTLLKYFTFFPVVAWLPIVTEPWVQMSSAHFAVAVAAIAAVHVMLRLRHRGNVRLHSNMPSLEDGEDEFPMKLGLRY